MVGADRIGQLIIRMDAGERRALSELFAEEGARLYGLCLYLARDDKAALSLYEHGWEAIWNSTPDFAASGLRGEDWLTLMMRELVVGDLRAARHARDRSDVERLADLPPAIGGEGALAGCLRRLGPDEAEAITRALLSGESEAELAQGFGLPVALMRAQLDHDLGEVDRCLGGKGQFMAARLVLGLSTAEEARLLVEGIEDDPELARAQARWAAAAAQALDCPPQTPPQGTQARIERRLFADDAGSILRRIGLIPSLVAALIGALLLYAAGQGMFGPGPPPGVSPEVVDD